MMDSSEVGRFGTLHLMKRLDPTAVAASYPIDDEEITIGRDPSCSIRLYYETVSQLHCKIIFRERKAFVEVLGTNGLFIDGCPVFPTSTPSSSPVTVPLPNNSTIEIHKKCFQFCYPPKELRPILLATPPRYQDAENGKHRRRTLRMSMIQSAQVFSPGPSEDPRENLKILQTPMKTPFRRYAPYEPSPLKRGAVAQPEEEDEEEEEIVLVESNNPKVVEEDNDLVILEHVEVDVSQSTPGQAHSEHVVQYPIPQTSQPSLQMQKTPRRRAHPRASLHRAVLIRSAQRTALKIEMEAEEEQEVEEVEETIQPAEMEDVEEENEDEAQEEGAQPTMSGWRKSLEAMRGGLTWPFRSSSVSREEEDEDEEHDVGDPDAIDEQDEQDIFEDDEEPPEDDFDHDIDPEEVYAFYNNNDQDDQPGPSHSKRHDLPTASAPAPPLGQFMTPQAPRISRDHARYSVGGFTIGGIRGGSGMSGPRRVKLVDPWKVNDIVVLVKDEVKEEDKPSSLPNLFSSPAKRERLSEEERKAIQERRRSALTTPDTFAPGIGHLSKHTSLSPTKAVPPPLPALNVGETIHEAKGEEDADEDTSIMLARMRQMVDGVKKRQSMGLRPSLGTGLSPRKPGQFSLFAPGTDLNSPRKASNPFAPVGETNPTEDEDIADEDAENKKPDGEQDVDMADTVEAPSEIPNITQASSSRRTLDMPAPATPKFNGVREMFKEAVEEMRTPKMDGMGELFRAERVMATPAYEGVGEMLATPATSRVAEQEHDAEPDEQTVSDNEEPVAPPPPVAPSRTRKPPSTSNSNTRIPAARRTTPKSANATQKQTPPEQLSAVPEDAVSPAESSQPKRSGTAGRVSRKPKSKAEESEPVPSSSRPTRARTVTKEGAEETKQSAKKVGDDKEAGTSAVPKPGPVRRGRKAAESSAPVEEPPSAPDTKSTRKPRTVKTPVQEDQPTTGTKASATRRGTRAKPVGVEEEKDPLDAIPRDDEDKKDAGAKVRRSARGKVKEEELEDSPALVAVPEEAEDTGAGTSRTTRTRKTPASKAVTPAVRSAAKGRAAVTSSKKTTVEDSAKQSTPGEAGNKENTPERNSPEEDPSDGDAPSSKPASGAKTGAKVTRSAGRLRATPTVEVEEKGKDARTRVSRSKTAAKK